MHKCKPIKHPHVPRTVTETYSIGLHSRIYVYVNKMIRNASKVRKTYVNLLGKQAGSHLAVLAIRTKFLKKKAKTKFQSDFLLGLGDVISYKNAKSNLKLMYHVSVYDSFLDTVIADTQIIIIKTRFLNKI